MSMELDKLSPEQLSDLINRAEKRKKDLHRQRIGEVRKMITDKAKAEGYSIEDLFGTGGSKTKARAKAPPKFCNPKDRSITWSGRGKRPGWYKDALAAGKSSKDLLIK